jgi:hypothetical protein
MLIPGNNRPTPKIPKHNTTNDLCVNGVTQTKTSLPLWIKTSDNIYEPGTNLN